MTSPMDERSRRSRPPTSSAGYRAAVLLFAATLFVPSILSADEDDEDDEGTALPVQTGPTDTHGGWDDDDDEDADDEDDDDDEDDEDDEEGPNITVDVGWNEPDGDAPFELLIGGYLRFGYTTIANDDQVEFVGRRDGFILHDARLELDGQLQNGLGFVFEMDGAVSKQTGDSTNPSIPLRLRLKDATIYYEPFDWLRADAGQFEPAFDVEELISTSDLLFINRSVGARGVDNVEGWNVDGLSVARQLGVRLRGGPYFPTSDDNSPEGPGGSLQVSATNGQEANQSLNDNEKLAYAARAGLHWGKYVRLGGAYYHNDQTIGDPPNTAGVTRYGWTADVTAQFKGATLIGSIIRMNEDTAEDNLPNKTSQSIQAQVAYEEPFIGLQPAYRFAWYDPSVDADASEGSPFDVDRRIHHTIGLNYRAQGYPLVVMANYTIAQEQDARQIDNNRFDALVQLSW